MKIIMNIKGIFLRRKYIKKFIDYKSDYYVENIKKKDRCQDGFCYDGYLWDALIKPVVINERDIDIFLKNKENIYIMWDIHSCEKIFVKNYWKYPKKSILFLERWNNMLKSELPEDIYIYDKTFKWTVIYTHETNEYGSRYCLLMETSSK